MTNEIVKVTIPESACKGLRHYQRSVLAYGHQAGVLSGADLKGLAKHWSGKYAHARRAVIDRMAKFGVESRLVLHPETRRWTRLWVHVESGKLAEIFIGENQ